MTTQHDQPGISDATSAPPHDDLAHPRLVAERSPIPIAVTVGDEHRIDHLNLAFRASLDGTLHAVEGVPIATVFERADEIREVLDRVWSTTTIERASARVAGLDGPVPYTLVVEPIVDDEGLCRGLLVEFLEERSAGRVPHADGSGAFDRLPESDMAEANEKLLLAGLREQELAARARRNAEELKALLENMAEGVLVINARGELVLQNPVVRTAFGIAEPGTVEDYRRADLRQVDGTPIDFVRDVLAPVLGGTQFSEREVLLYAPDVPPRHLVVSSSVVRDAGGSVALAIFVGRDITQLRELEQLRTQYAALISHDLRGPLSTALMAASLIGQVAEDPDRCRTLSGKIERSLDRMDRMLRDLLDVERIRAGETLPIRPSDCDLVEVARQAIDELAALHGDRFQLRGDASVRGYWSSEELSRAIWNLASNGIKYGRADTPVVITVERRGDRAILAVQNQGEPIAPDQRACLFRPFTRLHSSRADAPRGWGLGLTLVNAAVQAHHGAIQVHSEAETGTTFTIELPLDVRQANGEAVPE